MGRKLQIVVVDDEVMITDLIESFLRLSSRNAEVHCFNDPVRAKEFLSTHTADVLITDYKMPVVDGIQLIEATPPETKRIMISGYVSEIAEGMLEKLDAVFFEKPVPMKKLGEIIEIEERRKDN